MVFVFLSTTKQEIWIVIPGIVYRGVSVWYTERISPILRASAIYHISSLILLHIGRLGVSTLHWDERIGVNSARKWETSHCCEHISILPDRWHYSLSDSDHGLSLAQKSYLFGLSSCDTSIISVVEGLIFKCHCLRSVGNWNRSLTHAISFDSFGIDAH